MILGWSRRGVSLPLLLGSTCPSAAGPGAPPPQEASQGLQSKLPKTDGGEYASTSDYTSQ